MTLEEKIAELRRRRAAADAGGGPQRQERQHREKKLLGRERIELLFDEGTFEETDKLVTHRCTDFGMEAQKIPGDGYVGLYQANVEIPTGVEPGSAAPLVLLQNAVPGNTVTLAVQRVET